ncbi:phage tail terminator family protein [Lachnoclostridium phytofermentans]|uniref:Phage protein n=1 Tax=Lachnoclostridium phytofermentans (strain ATCC 700394 / DSM 18823 / ISDg) TaxID=357809 RepID=A9KQ05_LACP7|nr:hypothetical protein [Lachnoclostridium phytofermentans]ABX43317.1 phage protein [Lachnoclostridium phytofermentans ISDg]
MINEIIYGISKAIDQEFGDGYGIHTESIEQGLEEPCFFILCLNPTNELFLGKKYFRTNQFCIQYFPSTDKTRIECADVLDRLFDCLETITINEDLIMGTRMNGEIVDGVLNFMVNFNLFVYKDADRADEMDTVTVKSDAKG